LRLVGIKYVMRIREAKKERNSRNESDISSVKRDEDQRKRHGRITLLEKRFIVTPGIHYWCRLVIVADTNKGELTTRYQ
jgi:hypothetical protein